MPRLVSGGDDQSHVEAVASPGSHVDLRGGEVLDPYSVERLSSVAEPGPCEFVRRGPCGENARARISHRHKATGFRMYHDVVAIGEIVFERESIWRIAEQARDKCNCDRGHHQFPMPHAPPESRDQAEDHDP